MILPVVSILLLASPSLGAPEPPDPQSITVKHRSTSKLYIQINFVIVALAILGKGYTLNIQWIPYMLRAGIKKFNVGTNGCVKYRLIG